MTIMTLTSPAAAAAVLVSAAFVPFSYESLSLRSQMVTKLSDCLIFIQVANLIESHISVCLTHQAKAVRTTLAVWLRLPFLVLTPHTTRSALMADLIRLELLKHYAEESRADVEAAN